jgi:hypothetical protein
MSYLQRRGNAAFLLFFFELTHPKSNFGFILQCRVNPTTLGCIAGSLLLRKAASLAFEKNKRSTVTTDIIEFLGKRSVCLHPILNDLYFSSPFSCARPFALQLGGYLPCWALVLVGTCHACAALIMLVHAFWPLELLLLCTICPIGIGCYQAWIQCLLSSVVEKNCSKNKEYRFSENWNCGNRLLNACFPNNVVDL